MPILRKTQSSPSIIEPDENTPLVKYVDLVKFLSIIQSNSMFFCRLDKLEDRFEGTLPTATRDRIVKWWKYMRDEEKFFKTLFSDEDIEKKADGTFEFQNKMRSLLCVNCWNNFQGESYALWKIYAGINQGIMLKSSYEKLIQAFEKTPQQIYCSETTYINYHSDTIDFGNTFSAAIHKHQAYSYEQEIRFIHEVSNIGWEHDWDAEPYSHGVKVSCDITTAIDEIIISPFSPDWFKPLIEDLVNRYGLACPVIDSTLR